MSGIADGVKDWPIPGDFRLRGDAAWSLADQTLGELHDLLVPGGVLCLQLIQSNLGCTEYTIDSWAGDPSCSMLFTCYGEVEIQTRLSAAGFQRIEGIALPASPVYDNIPRLVERGITGFLVCAYRGEES
ncbi:MAG: hypothetical protein P4L99_20135 [Chthoniobacter sp.]|nr:hypothetical protein [Chthoniobacter sp.]